jgi:hypothetical protein
MKAGLLLFSVLAAASAAQASEREARGTGGLVGVRVEVEGRPSPLYTPDEERFYVEARPGARYAVTLTNRTRERLGVVLTVDGLNAISGERDRARGRMYVLGPWDETTVRGWRTSLDEVRRFTFVDERSSYAARTGQANGRMGWIEVAVYRERGGLAHVAPAPRRWPWLEGSRDRAGRSERPDDERRAPESAEAAPAPASPGPEAKSYGDRAAGAARGSYPGTGWGAAAEDRAVVVEFEPERVPSDRVTLRYEYRRALAELGLLPSWPPRDRLQEREGGFARPPAW